MSNSNAGPRPHGIFGTVPADVVKYWLEGKYYPGLHRPAFYEHLGWALMLRGYYLYRGFRDDKLLDLEYWGYGLLDLEDGELYGAGIRLHSSDPKDPAKGRPHPLLWRTEVCKIKPSLDPNEPTQLICVYHLAVPDDGAKDPVAPKVYAYFEDALNKKTMAARHDYDSGPLRDRAIGYLREHFDEDWRRLERVETSVYGVFQMDLRTFEPHENVEFPGRYPKTMQPEGHCRFRRIP